MKKSKNKLLMDKLTEVASEIANDHVTAHQIELRSTAAQMVYLNKAYSSRRHRYNQLLAHFSQPENKWSKAVGFPTCQLFFYPMRRKTAPVRAGR